MEALDKLLSQHVSLLAQINQNLSNLVRDSARLAKVTQSRQIRRLRSPRVPAADQRDQRVADVEAGFGKLREIHLSVEKALEDEAASMKRHQDQRPARQWQLDEIARLKRILGSK